MKKLLFLLFIFIVACSKPGVFVNDRLIVSSVLDNPDLGAYQVYLDNFNPIMDRHAVVGAREFTFNNCHYLLNKSYFKGVVVGESCGKNCLGGCPNTGPPYCYYVVQDVDGCVVFVKSHFWDFNVEHYIPVPGIVFNEFEWGEVVELTGKIQPYKNYYCGIQANDSKCTFFVSGLVWR